MATACSGNAPETVASSGVTQFTMDVDVSAMRAVLLLAVDDEATPEAESTRSATIGALRATFMHQLDRESAHLDTNWTRADLRIVLVHPSVVGSGRATAPSDDPALALVSDRASSEDVGRLADAAARAIQSSVAPAGARYALLDATIQTVALLTRARLPADTHERAVLDSLGRPEYLAFALATSRDDASMETVQDLAWPSPPSHFFVAESSIVRLADDALHACDLLDPASRLGQWEAMVRRSHIVVDAYDPRCAQVANSVRDLGLLDTYYADYGNLCLPSPPRRTSGGETECQFYFTIADDAPCVTYPGMRDPLDREVLPWPRTIATDAGLAGRLCEVQELPSRPTEECAMGARCENCGPGWCITEPGGVCPYGEPRFLGGALPRSAGELHMVCDLE